MQIRYDLRGFKELSAVFRDAPRRVQDLARKWLREDVAEPQAEAIRREAPSRSGRFRKTIQTYARAMVVGVRFEPYGRLGLKLKDWILEGTPPHVIYARLIYARRARALHFFVKGEEVFAKHVNHPGTKPNDFITRGAKKFDPKVRGLEKELKRRIVADLQAQIKRKR